MAYVLRDLVVLPYIIPYFPDGASVIDVLEACLNSTHTQRSCRCALIPKLLTCLHLLQSLSISLTEFLKFGRDDHHAIALPRVLAVVTLVIILSEVERS